MNIGGALCWPLVPPASSARPSPRTRASNWPDARRGASRPAAQARGGCFTFLFDAYDLDACASAVRAVGGVGDDISEYLMTVNAPAFAASLQTALRVLGSGGASVAVTGAVAVRAEPGMADCSASKASRSAWLDAVRREASLPGNQVVDIRLGHLETGFAAPDVAGLPRPMPKGGDLGFAVRTVAQARATDAERVVRAKDGTPVLERRAK